MNLSFFIAKRYLFSRKSHNAINIISMIAVGGVAVATMATVCVLSVMNGFRDMVTDMFSSFDPELKVTPVRGKVFDPSTDLFLPIYDIPEIDLIVETLEDQAMLQCEGKQAVAVLKGVGDGFNRLSGIDNILYVGEFKLRDEVNHYASLGYSLAQTLGVAYSNYIYPFSVYTPRRNAPVNMSNPSASFREESVYMGSIFATDQPMYDENYLIVSIDLARKLFDYDREVSALELKLAKDVNLKAVQRKIQALLGDDYEVKDLYQQQEESFRMLNIEKFVVFLIACFIVLIAVFNIIGSLSMLMVDKQSDIVTLRNMGADNRLISRIFLFEGWMISALGAVGGVCLGLLIALLQQHFGWIKMGALPYPVVVEALDLLLVFVAVIAIGFLSVAYPVRYLSKKWLS